MKTRTVEACKSKYVRISDRKFWKRLTHKLWRKMAKEAPEDAPRRKPIRGWID